VNANSNFGILRAGEGDKGKRKIETRTIYWFNAQVYLKKNPLFLSLGKKLNPNCVSLGKKKGDSGEKKMDHWRKMSILTSPQYILSIDSLGGIKKGVHRNRYNDVRFVHQNWYIYSSIKIDIVSTLHMRL